MTRIYHLSGQDDIGSNSMRYPFTVYPLIAYERSIKLTLESIVSFIEILNENINMKDQRV